jgi:hypothetical protein
MQQRQLRLGDILDDYCPRERRVTNHAVVAMIGEDVKQTRCTTCDADHEYKHAKVPRQRRKSESPAALYSQVLANGPKRVSHDSAPTNGADEANGHDAAADDLDRPADETADARGNLLPEPQAADVDSADAIAAQAEEADEPPMADEDERMDDEEEEGPVHRPLIRASLPRPEGQQPPARPIPEFTIRQPGGRPNRFRPRGVPQRGMGGGGQQFPGNRSNGNTPGGPPRGMRSGGGRPPHNPQGGGAARLARRNGPGRKRSK